MMPEKIIFVLSRDNESPEVKGHYDITLRMVIVAPTASEARDIAARDLAGSFTEDAADWRDLMITTCDRIGIADESAVVGIVCCDFKAG